VAATWISAASDVDLAGNAARGDRAAFAELARRAGPPTLSVLRRMGAPAPLAEDISQEALIAAYRSIGAFRGEAAFASWVTRIAARLYLKRRKKEARYVLLAESEAEAGSEGEPETQRRIDLDRALAQLSPAERLSVSLCHGAGLTHEEIATALKLPLGTVKSHVTRGLAKLRRRLVEEHHG